MKKILRLNFIVSTVILCLTFLFCGIVEINDKTSYVITGQKSEVFHSQKTNGTDSISLAKNDPENSEDTTFLSLDFAEIGKVAGVVKYCCAPPFGCIISFLEETDKS